MKYKIVLCLVSGSLWVTSPSPGQIATDGHRQRQEAGVLGGLSPDILSKIKELAILVQKKMADGQMNAATLQQELQGGDVGAAVRGLGPDASRLLDEIKASLQSNSSEDSLSLLPQALTGAVP